MLSLVVLYQLLDVNLKVFDVISYDFHFTRATKLFYIILCTYCVHTCICAISVHIFNAMR